ncbi:MAG: twin-arginine translocation signal domain-containing protein, partial [Phycisphaerae bacterium]
MKQTRRDFLKTIGAASAGAAGALSWKELLAMADNGAAPAPAAKETSMPATPKLPDPLDEPIPESHVGSLLGPISRIRDAYGWAADSFALDKYKPADHAAWRKQMLAAVMESMHYAPAKCDFDAKVVETVDCGKFTRQKVYFNTTPELRVPAFVLIPKGAD